MFVEISMMVTGHTGKVFRCSEHEKWQPSEWNNTKSYALYIGCFDFCCTCSL